MRVIIEDAHIAFGPTVVLDDFSCTVEPDTVTALVGPSGSGKSTLLSVIAGYEKLKHGHVWFEELDGSRHTPDSSQIVWVPQGSNALGARTALDNVMLGPLSTGLTLEAASDRALAALTDVGLAHKAEQAVRELSGGELQRVNFARGIAAGQRLILADEPSSSLDEANTLNVAALLADLASRATIVVATHDPVLVAAAETVIYLRSHHDD